MADFLIHVIPPVLYVLCGLRVANWILSKQAFWKIIRECTELECFPDQVIVVVVTFWSVLCWPPMYIVKFYLQIKKRLKK